MENMEYLNNMKKGILVLVGAMIMSVGMAQSLPQEKMAIVYYSPINYVVLNFEYSITSSEVGIYAQYAEECLGIKDVVHENETNYSLENVRISRRSEVDLTRSHTIFAEKGTSTQLVAINKQGILVGYNMPIQNNEPRCKERPHAQPDKCTQSIAPIPEEVLGASSHKAQANALAKHIFRIRETRMYLLSGEVEHAPADGTAMKKVLDELDKQERELTALFIGRKEIRKEIKEIVFCPARNADKPYEDILFFSKENGFTDAENIDADRISIRAEYRKPEIVVPIGEKPSKKSVEPSQIVYNTPGYACVSVNFKGKELGKRTLPIAQLGVDMSLPKDLFTGNELPKIVFCEHTGNIVSISK